jgi:peptide/nickel transport system permease protein
MPESSSLQPMNVVVPQSIQSGPESPTRLALRRFSRNQVAIASMAILILMALASIFAPYLGLRDPILMAPVDAAQAPSVSHFLGTDSIGRDTMSRIFFGGRITLSIGLVSVLTSAVIGILLGLFAGYFGKHIDTLIMRFIDMLLAFPGILLALSIISFLGPGLFNVMIAVGISGIPTFARLVRGSVLSAKEDLYVEAARSLGCNDRRIIFLHILPNIIAPVIILASLAYGWAILTAASLSFLGLGAQPPTPEWGIMLNDGRSYMQEAPWITIFPGLAIMLTVLCANLFSEGLRDAMDPHLRL